MRSNLAKIQRMLTRLLHYVSSSCLVQWIRRHMPRWKVKVDLHVPTDKEVGAVEEIIVVYIQDDDVDTIPVCNIETHTTPVPTVEHSVVEMVNTPVNQPPVLANVSPGFISLSDMVGISQCKRKNDSVINSKSKRTKHECSVEVLDDWVITE